MTSLLIAACAAIVSVGSTTAHAQVTAGRIAPFTLRPAVGASPTTAFVMRSSRPLQAPASARSGARARSKKRVVAGAIVGGVAGFFAGGALGAFIEGDRCNCDDPGLKGAVIGAPIGAAVGAILGGKFLF